MSRTLSSMVLDLLVEERRSALFGGLAWYGSRLALHWARLSSGEGEVWDEELGEAFGDRVTLRPTSPFSGVYTTGAGGAGYLGTYLRTVPQAKQWAAIELLGSEPAGTQLRYLLGNAAGQTLRWTGAAWAATDPAVAANWNTAAQVMAGFPSWTGTAVRVLARLQTSDSGATPVFYGARTLVRLAAPSVEEELVHRTLVPYLRRWTVAARYRVTATGASTIDLSGIAEYRIADESGAPALAVVSVHDLTADPGEAAELLSAWNPTTHVATLSAAPASGHILQLDLEVTPLVARVTSQDFLELARLPAITVEQLRLTPEGQAARVPRRTLVRDTAAKTARVIPPPEKLVATFALRLVAQYDVDLLRLIASAERAASSGASAQATSAVTGELVRLRRLTEWNVQDGGISATATWEARGLQAFRHVDASAPLLGTVTVDPETRPVG